MSFGSTIEWLLRPETQNSARIPRAAAQSHNGPAGLGRAGYPSSHIPRWPSIEFVTDLSPTRSPDALGPEGHCAAGQPFGLGRARTDNRDAGSRHRGTHAMTSRALRTIGKFPLRLYSVREILPRRPASRAACSRGFPPTDDDPRLLRWPAIVVQHLFACRQAEDKGISWWVREIPGLEPLKGGDTILSGSSSFPVSSKARSSLHGMIGTAYARHLPEITYARHSFPPPRCAARRRWRWRHRAGTCERQ
jgi:hypothetical protein